MNLAAPVTTKSRRLRRLLVLFFLALLLPTCALLYFAFSQMKWEVYHQFRVQAEALATSIDAELRSLINLENSRKFSDFRFLRVDKNNRLTISDLAKMPGKDSIPGLVGHFQIEANGQFSSPLVPDPGIDANRFGISSEDLALRIAMANRIGEILRSGHIIDAQNRVSDDLAALPNTPQHSADSASHQDNVFSDREFSGSISDPSASNEALTRFDNLSKKIIRQNRQRLGSVAELQLDESLEKKAIGSEAVSPSPAVIAPREEGEIRRKEQVTAYNIGPQEFFSKQTFDAPNNDAPPANHSTELESAKSKSAVAAADQAPLATVADKLESANAVASELSSRGRQEAATSGTLVSSTITSFESEVEPISLTVFDDDHLVLYRNVWRGGERLIQGAVLHEATFIDKVVEEPFVKTSLANMSQLLVAFQDDVLHVYGGANEARYLSNTDSLTGSLLFKTNLSVPFSQYSLIFNITSLPLGTSIKFLSWVSAVLLCVLISGCFFMYRFGLGQIELNQQQQDFVSAVSHELKTPLTSIRMYSEMLKNGWASDEKKLGYYQYIHGESERLSRLIDNVLQLARINRNSTETKLESLQVSELMTNIISAVSSLVDNAEYQLNQYFEPSAMNATVVASHDAVMQIAINLVDNAVKFSRHCEIKAIDIRCNQLSDGRIEVGIRDYGPGIEPTQMKKIFDLFYRTENELTRETVGTGIGLALVQQLATSMDAKIDARNCNPGVEFTITWPSSEQLDIDAIRNKL